MSRSQSTPQSSQMIWLESRIEQLEAELANIKEIEFPKRVEKVAEGWRGKCETLEAENEQLSLYKNLADEYGLSVFADLAELQKQRDDKVQCCQRCYSVFPTQSEGGAK